MSIVYDPTKLLKKIAPESKIEKLLTKNLTLKKAALSFIDDIDFLNKKNVTATALKVVKSYKARLKEDEGSKKELKDEIKADPALLIQRVQNEVLLQVKEGIKEKYSGEFYIWLPSDADEPDPEHQLNYGKKFQIGDGEMPQDRYGCRCGMEILVDEKTLEL